jgi:hypothetical protein
VRTTLGTRSIARRSGEFKKNERENPIPRKGIKRKENLLKWALSRPMTFQRRKVRIYRKTIVITACTIYGVLGAPN